MKGYFEAGEWEAGGFNVDLSVCFICCHFFRYVFFFKAFSLFFFSSVFWILTFLLCFSVLSQPLFFFFLLFPYIYIYTHFYLPTWLSFNLFALLFFSSRAFSLLSAFFLYIYIYTFSVLFFILFLLLYSSLFFPSSPSLHHLFAIDTKSLPE